MRKKNQDGAIVIEATISLTAFMFLIVTILAIVNICLVQTKVGVMVHGVAKDISNYTYIYTMAGLNEKEKTLSGKADYSRNKIDEVINGSEQVLDTVQNIGDAIMDQEFWDSMVSLIQEALIQEVKGEAIDAVCGMVAEKRLAGTGYDANDYLTKLGVVGGLGGLDFTKSEMCSGGGDDIKIIVQYDVHVLRLLGVDFQFHFEQCAYTKTWCSLTYSLPSSGSSSESAGEISGSSDVPDGNPGTGNDNVIAKDDAEETEEDKNIDQSAATNTVESEREKTVDEYVRDATHNGKSDEVMLGKYTQDSNTNYVDRAEKENMTYFSLDDDDWEELNEQGSDAVWEVNRRFLEEQERAGKTFYLSSDPYYATGYFSMEVEWLINQGYHFVYDQETGLYRAVRD